MAARRSHNPKVVSSILTHRMMNSPLVLSALLPRPPTMSRPPQAPSCRLPQNVLSALAARPPNAGENDAGATGKAWERQTAHAQQSVGEAAGAHETSRGLAARDKQDEGLRTYSQRTEKGPFLWTCGLASREQKRPLPFFRSKQVRKSAACFAGSRFRRGRGAQCF